MLSNWIKLSNFISSIQDSFIIFKLKHGITEVINWIIYVKYNLIG